MQQPCWCSVIYIYASEHETHCTFFECRKKHSDALVFKNGAENTSLHPTFLLFTGPLSDLGLSTTLMHEPGASKSILFDAIQERVKVLINAVRISNSIDSLEHRRTVACVSLFY